MKEELKQNGKILLSSEDDITISTIFNNLSGKNFSGKKYKDYLIFMSQEIGLKKGRIERCRNGEIIEIAEIHNI